MNSNNNPYLRKVYDSFTNSLKSFNDNVLISNTTEIKSVSNSFPLSNENPSPVIATPYGRGPEVDYDTLWAYFKASPELQAILTAIVDDIISDGWRLEGGRNNVQRAEKFLSDNHAKEILHSVLIDTLLTGDGYIWKDSFTKSDFRKSLTRVIKKRHNGYEQKSISDLTELVIKSTEEDLFSTRQFIDIPSSTIKITANKYGDVQHYIQRPMNSAESVMFTPEQIVHFRLMRINGKVYGYSPTQSLLTIMDVLDDIRDYTRYYFRKGGVPNYMFIMEDANSSDNDYKEMKKAIQQYANITHKYKNLVLTGKVEVKELNKMDHDMEFRELARYLTQLMVMVWSIPSSRLSDLLVGTGVTGSNTSTEGYYRKVGHIQNIYEDMINSQLLDEYKVTLRFNRTYKQDEVRETQIAMMRADTLTKNQDILARYDLRLTKDKLLHEMGLIDTDVEEHKEKIIMQGNSTNRQNQLNNHQMLTESTDKLAQDKVKQDKNVQVKSDGPFQEYVKQRTKNMNNF
ncbi:MAG: phage portal protein [Methanosarcinaceae archaeon]|nr:phage portal protein [Methanosarcinaceae archaeon]